MPNLKKINIGDLEFDCRFSGDSKNELVIFLHGFPETSIMWQKIMVKVSESGFYCIAPDLRGYSKDACPKGKKNYSLKNLRADRNCQGRTKGKVPPGWPRLGRSHWLEYHIQPSREDHQLDGSFCTSPQTIQQSHQSG